MPIDFDGTNDELRISSLVASISAPCSAAFWVKLGQTESTEKQLFRLYLNYTHDVGVTYGVNGKFLFYSSDATDRGYVQPSATPVALTWYHIAVVLDGTNNGILYVDGVNAANKATGKNPQGMTAVVCASNIGGRYLNGTISDLGIWSAALSSDEVSLLHSSRMKYLVPQIQAANLKVYLPFDDFADGATASGANTIIDRSGNGNHGTPINSPVGKAEAFLSYPAWPQIIVPEAAAVGTVVKDIIQPGIIAFPR